MYVGDDSEGQTCFLANGEKERALEMLDKCQESVPEESYPLESICLGFSANDYMVITMIEDYLYLGERDKGIKLAAKFGDALMTTARFYLQFYPYEKKNFETCTSYAYYLIEGLKDAGEVEFAGMVSESLNQLLGTAKGEQ